MAAARRAPWSLSEVGFVITFTRGLSPTDILTRYGVDPGTARPVTWQQAVDEQMFGAEATVLRVGMLGQWAFCHQDRPLEKPSLDILSEGTDSLSLLDLGGGETTFQHWRDGLRYELFRPGFSYSRPRSEPHPFWDRISARHAAGLSGAKAALAVIEEHVRGEVTHDLLAGPLLTTAVTTGASVHPPGAPGFA
ncbi:hypothetical protein [Kineosporia sp. NBRC 101731]|uniref:hypothetical protein n=1 Tax=Kineosporia sp. NBRC 101731 TaxID=3032199 RepID=UPI0024A0F3EA|nr:hypothetical protein [Kineosporia sp. NBRC 101731]GLY29948.1 hypothetical protein Kisp02_33130 [Kineosporia sp. NBRC 101731]